MRAEVNAAVGTLLIDNKVRHNALSFDMWAALPALLQRLDDDNAVRVIVLQGAGDKAFASGSDISQFGERRSTPQGVALYNATVDAAVAALAAVRKPTVAKINGYCFGGGVALALHCDIRYATTTSTFSIPAGKVGVGYNALWLQRLAGLVGPGNAKEIMFTAARYDARQAERMGLVNQILDMSEMDERIQTIASLAPLTHRASKLAIDTAVRSATEGLEQCQAAIMQCFMSQDYVEGRTAFEEKRTPNFVGA